MDVKGISKDPEKVAEIAHYAGLQLCVGAAVFQHSVPSVLLAPLPFGHRIQIAQFQTVQRCFS